MRLTVSATGAAVTANAVVGGFASRPARSPWYARLRKPSYQPPRQVFPVLWPLDTHLPAQPPSHRLK